MSPAWADPVATSTRSAAPAMAAPPSGDPDLLGTAVEAALAASKGDAQGVVNALPRPAPGIAAAFAAMGLSRLALKSGINAGGTGLFFNGLFWISAIGIPFAYLTPFFAEKKPQPDIIATAVELDARVYLLTYDKKSPLTGSFKREPSGLGLGYDFAARYSHPEYGFLAGGELTFQQSEIDGNDFVNVSGFFVKLDAKVGWDAARFLGWLADWDWLRRQRLAVRVGPSVFHNWVYMGEEGGLFSSRPRNARLNRGLGLATGLGYEVSAEASLDFGWVGGVRVMAQRGDYPSLSFPEVSGNDAALFVLIGFEDLRGGDRYVWQRVMVDLDFPLVGFSKSGTLTLGGQLSRLEAGTGAAVNNRGFSLGGSWRW